MKLSLILFSTTLLLFVGLQSCNEDIVLTGDFEETAVVYGLIDKSDSVHIIKITRAFIGPGNSLQIAQIPDSSYFQSVNATITEKVNGSTARTWQLFDTTITNKEEGVFYAPEQIVYAFYTQGKDNSNNPTNQSLRDDADYELHIILNQGLPSEFEVFGKTEIVSGVSTNTDNSTYQFKFAKNATITGEYVNSSISVLTGNSAVVNAKLKIHYSDFIGADTVYQTIDWNLGEVETSGGTKLFNTSGQTFYTLINNSCNTSTASVSKRNMEGLTVEIVAGSVDLYNYILVNSPSSTIAQNKPTYTNLTASEGHSVLGIFSSRMTHRVYHPMMNPVVQNVRCIDRNSTMELCIGPIAGAQLFCSQQTLDIATNQPWACN